MTDNQSSGFSRGAFVAGYIFTLGVFVSFATPPLHSVYDRYTAWVDTWNHTSMSWPGPDVIPDHFIFTAPWVCTTVGSNTDCVKN